jgi:hypothetical protein
MMGSLITFFAEEYVHRHIGRFGVVHGHHHAHETKVDDLKKMEEADETIRESDVTPKESDKESDESLDKESENHHHHHNHDHHNHDLAIQVSSPFLPNSLSPLLFPISYFLFGSLFVFLQRMPRQDTTQNYTSYFSDCLSTLFLSELR